MMMKTSRVMPEYYYKPNEIRNGHNNRSRDYVYVTPKNTTYVKNRSQQGPYNATEKDFRDHKVRYLSPTEYENDYDTPQLDERPVYDEEHEEYYSPRSIRRRYYREPDDNYNEELPMVTPRRYIAAPQVQPKVIKRIYYRPTPTPPSPSPVEYIHENDYRPKNEEIVEYVVPRKRYIEESQPIHRPLYTETLPRITRSPPRASPSPAPLKTLRFNEFTSSRHSTIKQQTPRRTTTILESPHRSFSQSNNKKKQLPLKDVLAQNRARRGSRIPIIRREVDEVQYHDLPTYNKNYVKNDFIVHK